MMDQKKHTIDFTSYIAERTENFTGRKWAFQAINDWLADPAGSRFFLLTGSPGSGKTAIASRLAQFSQGTVPPLEGLTYLIPDFLSAIHFCSTRDSRWINPHVFSESLAIQLAERYPLYAKALAEKSGDRQIRIEVKQQFEEGQAIGVVINRLDVSGVAPEDAFNRTVREPLEGLSRDGHTQQVIILIDALDEALRYSGSINIVSLLAQAANFPTGIRFLMTTRPEIYVLRPLRRFPLEEHTLTFGKGLTYSLDDIQRYVLDTVAIQPKLATKLVSSLSPEAFAHVVQQKSEGNFLYVRYLLKMLADQREQISHETLNTLPAGLDGIYVEFLERLVGEDLNSWAEKYGPIVGTLAIAQEALTEKQLADFVETTESKARSVLTSLRQFLDMDDTLPASQRTYALYHRSFADFLLDEDRAEEYWCEAEEQHQRIVDYYRSGAQGWEQVDWRQVDDYGLHHLATHLFALRNVAAFHRGLYSIICKSFMLEKHRRYGSHQSFATNVALAIEAARSEEPPDIVQEVRGYLIYTTLGSIVTFIPMEALGLLTRLGQVAKARGYASLIQSNQKRSLAYLYISEALLVRGNMKEAIEALRQASLTVGYVKEVKEDILNRVVKVVARASNRGDTVDLTAWALTLTEMIRDDQTQLLALSSVARILAIVGQNTKAADTALRVLTAAEAIDGGQYILKAEALSAVVQVFKGVGEKEGLIRVMIALETIENAEALSKVAQTLAQAGEKTRAIEVVGRALSIAETIGSEVQKAQLLSTVASALAQVGEKTKAVDIANQALEVAETIGAGDYEKNDALIAVAQAFEHIGETTKAVEVANQAIAATPITQEYRPEALSSIAQALAEVGEKARALVVANRALAAAEARNEFKHESLSAVAQALAQIGDRESLKRALFAAEAIEKPYYWSKLEALRAVANALAQVGEIEGLNQILKIAKTFENMELRAQTIIAVAQALAEVGEKARALVVANRALAAANVIENEGSRAQALSLLALALAKIGERARATRIVNRALVAAETIADPDYQKVDALSTVAQALTQMGEEARATRIVNRALVATAAFEDQDYSKGNAISALVSVLAKVGDKEGLDRAMKAAKTIEDKQYRVYALTDVAKALGQVGEQAKAVDVANQALAAAEVIEYGGWGDQRTVALDAVAKTLAELGQHEAALVVWRSGFAGAQLRWRVFISLGNGASLIAAIDQGQTLWALYEAIIEVDSWWGVQ